MKKLIFVATLLLSTLASAGNLGHRMAGGIDEYYRTLPENSLSSLKALMTRRRFIGILPPLQYHRKFDYLEFDVQETYDGHLIVFHDKTIGRLFDQKVNSKEAKKLMRSSELLSRLIMINQAADPNLSHSYHKSKALVKHPGNRYSINYKNLRIQDLTLKEIKRLKLIRHKRKNIFSKKYKIVRSKESAPTLDEVLNMIKKYKLIKPVAVEVKYIYSQQAQQELIDFGIELRRVLKNVKYTKKYDFPSKEVVFFGFEKAKTISFPYDNDFDEFCDGLKDNGFKNFYGPGSDHTVGKCEF